jgi:hypothetical protein
VPVAVSDFIVGKRGQKVMVHFCYANWFKQRLYRGNIKLPDKCINNKMCSGLAHPLFVSLYRPNNARL